MNTESTLYRCRLCLQKTPTKVDLYQGNFPEMVKLLTSITFRQGDGFPKFSCTKCVLDVEQAVAVRERILSSQMTLLEYFEKKRKKNSLKKSIVKNVSQHKEKSKKIEASVVKEEIVEDAKPVNIISVITVNQNGADTSDNKPKQVKGNKPSDNIIHTELKDETVLYRCKLCNITFNVKYLADNHRNTHRNSKCTICGKIVRTYNFRKHLRGHSEKPVNCKKCGATCKNTESLRGHMFYQHKCTSDTYICEECGEKFRTRYRFTLHKKKVHIGQKDFKCETCGRSFFTQADLNCHINKTHKKIRPHICEFCGNGYRSMCALKSHKMQHTDEKPYSCQYCSEGFRQKVSLRSHLKSKHGYVEAEEFFCNQCERGFVSNTALQVHERLHSVQKCSHCSENFGDSQYLKKHLKEVHNVES